MIICKDADLDQADGIRTFGLASDDHAMLMLGWQAIMLAAGQRIPVCASK